MKRKNLFFLLFFILALLMAYGPLKALFDSASQQEYYSHIVLIPLVSIYLVFQKRKLVFSEQENMDGLGADSPLKGRITGIFLLLAAALLYFAGRGIGAGLNQNDYAALITLAAVVFLNGGFILSYGWRAFKKAIFPLLFLVFAIPIPSALMESFIRFLQVGSTEFANLLFTATGVPFFREGFVFHLPGVNIEVAKQCSGIRSCLALLITAILAGHLFLETGWKKVILVICALPIAMFKNGIRIVTLTLLGTYVDPRILQSSLHRDGGIPFFVAALLLMAPILYGLRKSEKRKLPGIRNL